MVKSALFSHAAAGSNGLRFNPNVALAGTMIGAHALSIIPVPSLVQRRN